MIKSIVSIKRVAAFGMIFSLLAAIPLFVDRISSASRALPASATITRASPAQAASEVRHAQQVRIWVHGDDLYPPEVRVRPGRVLLRAENQKQSDITLVLERVMPGEGREAVTRFNTAWLARRSEQEVRLGAGEYLFYEESNPELKGSLIVEPR